MKFIRLAQSSPEWLDWRRTGVTASDVSCLFGTNPYKTEWKLWAEKTGLQVEDNIDANPYVRMGKAYEHMLREHVVEDRNVGIMPVCVEHDTLPFLKASLDGIDRHKRPWEFKVPSERNFEEVRKHRLDSEPAQRYLLQVQHQMLVTGADEGYLIFGKIDDTGRFPKVVEYIFLIIPTDPKIQESIRQLSDQFMKKVQGNIEPAKDPNRDVFAPSDPHEAARWQTATAALLPLLAKKAALKAQLDLLDRDISDVSRPIVDVLGANKYGEFAGLRATRVDRKGNVDWSSYLTDHGFDPTDEKKIGPYRKAGSTNVQFTTL